MRWFVALATACGTDAVPPDAGEPYARVVKLNGHERLLSLDDAAYAAFAAGEMPARFTVTMDQRDSQGVESIFIRTLDGGVWYSSSPTPRQAVDITPSIEPGCDGCHDDNAEMRGMFTLPAALAAPPRGDVARIDCPEPDVTPCEHAVYRALRFE